VRLRLFLLPLTLLLASPTTAASQILPYVLECNGSDVTTELQEFIEDSVTGPSYLQFTPGECVISETVKICNKEGIRIEGAGRGSTVLVWQPVPELGEVADTGPMFSIQNSAFLDFSHFGIRIAEVEFGTVTLNSAFDLYNNCVGCEVEIKGLMVERCSPYGPDGYFPLAQPHSHGNRFDDIEIRAGSTEARLHNGVRVRLYGRRVDLQMLDDVAATCALSEGACTLSGTTDALDLAKKAYSLPCWDRALRADCHNDGHSFRNVHVSEFRDSAFVLEGRNTKGTVFENCHCDGSYGGDGDTFDPETCGMTCVKTGQFEDNSHTAVEGPEPNRFTSATHFSWFGGTAENLADTVFLLGASSDPIVISGLTAMSSRQLIYAAYWEDQPSAKWKTALLVDSVSFDTAHVHAWDEWSGLTDSRPPDMGRSSNDTVAPADRVAEAQVGPGKPGAGLAPV